jgi:hypothetical protein
MLRRVFNSILLIACVISVRAQGLQIPVTHATALSGESVILPEALHGKVGILVVGFSQESRDGVTKWGRRLAAQYQMSPTVLCYEMPMLASVPRVLRGLIVRSMKSSVPAPVQSHFVPLTTDEAAWRALVHYSKSEDAYVLVVDESGKVRWQTEGGPTSSAEGALRLQVDALKMN